jgi:hypothetical protein
VCRRVPTSRYMRSVVLNPRSRRASRVRHSGS